jgi:hypothetical protein
MDSAKQLAVVSKAWGRQSGYCFFPWIDGDAATKEERVKGYHEGPAFLWPRDKQHIQKHIEDHGSDDIYWCPSLFEKPQRKMELAMDEHALWADLDEVDPRSIEDYPPTVAWESSPGRYQALWIITNGDMQGASWAGGENQKLTYHIGADVSGWDTTQLLRIPGARNHKFEYWHNGNRSVDGRLLWESGRRYLPDDFEDLPEVANVGAQVSELLETEIERVDRHEVWARVRLRVSKRVRELVAARQVTGDRSSALWEIERELADAGCSITEIVAIARATVWNKFNGRSDELRRLTSEAAKALDMVGLEGRKEGKEKPLESLEDTDAPPKPKNLMELVKDVKPPDWLVDQIIAVGSCAFIAGQPKTFKSWLSLDMALSVANGSQFLDHFPIKRPGPVLYLQEEDSLPMVKRRLDIVAAGKKSDKVTVTDEGVVWLPAEEHDDLPKVNAVVRGGLTLSLPGHQVWLEEAVADGYDGEGAEPYALVIIDTLISTAGEVNENSSSEMQTKIFKPLRVIAEKHKCAILIIHHMRKESKESSGSRGGTQMLGSTAAHGFAEDALYVKFNRGDLLVERESKNTVSGSFKITGLRAKGWHPAVTDDRMALDDQESDAQAPQAAQGSTANGRLSVAQRKVLDAIGAMGGRAKNKAIAEKLGITAGGAYRQLKRLEDMGMVSKVGDYWKT